MLIRVKGHLALGLNAEYKPPKQLTSLNTNSSIESYNSATSLKFLDVGCLTHSARLVSYKRTF